MAKLKSLQVIHEAVDEKVGALAVIHGERLKCSKGCHDCCQDDLSIFEVEAARIQNKHSFLLEHGQPHPAGKCAFLDQEGACRIYSSRPYVCRTQGLPLRWIVDSYEYRDICPLNDEGDPIEDIGEELCWTLGEFEGKLAQLQGDLKRVRLRDLFSGPARAPKPADR
ncbi:MAG: YkgJ family cysteine cluster protein [Myxococcota bacterium]|nr:YkgJ family cysteine cluster protein [Myxococcota bacterium]